MTVSASSSGRAGWLKIALVVLGAILVAVFSILISLPYVLPSESRPLTTALPLGGSAKARATFGSSLLDLAQVQQGEGDKRQWAQYAAGYARSALRQEPGNVEAARTLALANEALGRRQAADRLLLYANSLSRRDVPTQLALGERAQVAGKVDQAMVHYGNVMATSWQTGAVLARIGTPDDPALQDAIGRRLAAGPPWRFRFLTAYTGRARSAPALYRISAATWGKGLPAQDRRLASTVLRRLIALNAPEEARSLYAKLTGDKARPSLVNGGGFEPTEGLPPFIWTYIDSGRLAASPQPAPSGKGRVLELRARSAARGVVASQMIMLAPGTYTLAFRAGDLSRDLAGRPTVRVACLRTGGKRSIARLVQVMASATADVSSGSFSVPANCPFQSLEIWFGAPATATDATSWVDDVSIAPL